MTEQPTLAELISGAAHELRSPLTSVKGFSNTLVSRWDRFSDQERREFVGVINADAERMARIVSEVIDLARLDSGTLELHRAPVQIDSLVRKVLDGLAGRKGAARAIVDIPESLTVWADRERLERDLGNIVENALKFSPVGPVTIAARTDDNERVVIAVVDEGIGIEEDRLPGVLSGPGPRGQMAPSRTGLGLYLARRVLELQGGSLSVTSELGTGSTFTIQLPVTGSA
jgi:signal transduction histidine kinase